MFRKNIHAAQEISDVLICTVWLYPGAAVLPSVIPLRKLAVLQTIIKDGCCHSKLAGSKLTNIILGSLGEILKV